ncbi:DUF3592 domain-containing protein [Alteromonas sp. 14N.309.X.WAT.G.H12]|uniref:DUF3592 domain-containing protein n=1 Tax=Alteromonas sp. 14N.309.X.WAT.G.H12 TaxID=3120824 RepID=UPI002FCEEF94
MFNNSKVFYIVSIIASLIWVVYLSNSLYRSFDTYNWESVTGEIVAVEAVRTSDSREKYILLIDYIYVIGGNEFSGNNKNFSKSKLNLDEMNEKLNASQVGDKIQLYFNPNNPTESVMSIGISKSVIFLLLISTSILLFASAKLKKLL